MCLYASGEIIEAAVVGYFPGSETAREVVDFVGHGVPLTVKFFGVGAGWSFTWVALFD